MPLNISKGDKTIYKEGNLTVEGDIKLDLKLKDSNLEVVAAIKGTPENVKNDSSTGMPWWGIVLIAIATGVLGFVISRMIPRKETQA